MSVEALETLLRHPAPAFICCPGGGKRHDEALIVPLKHLVNGPANRDALQRIPLVPGADAAQAFYERYDGALLYTANGLLATRGGTDEGIELFPLGEWAARTDETLEFWNASRYEDDEMPYGRNDFVAIAHSRGTFSYVHMVVRGPNAGAIYWWATTMPPETHDSPLATGFGDFIETICTKPIHFLNELLFGYTRFLDGKTSTQWVPNRYVPDRTKVGISAAG